MSLDRAWAQVSEFHMTFGHPCSYTPKALTAPRRQLRANWMREEVAEFEAADDLVDQADAMVDLIYFALGSLVEMGIKPAEIFDAVHVANMQKCWFDGLPRFDSQGKVIKSPEWKGPEQRIKEIICQQMRRRCEEERQSMTGFQKSDHCLAECLIRVISQRCTDCVVKPEAVVDAIGRYRSRDDTNDDRLIGSAVEPSKIEAFLSDQIGPTQVKYLLANTMEEWDFERMIREEIGKATGLICTLSAGKFFGHDRIDLGHAVTVEDIAESTMTVFDPGPESRGLRVCSIEDIYLASRARAGGLIVISIQL